MYIRHIARISRVYVWSIIGISYVYLGHISDISQVYLRYLSDTSQPYVWHILGEILVYLRHILYLMHISGISRVYLIYVLGTGCLKKTAPLQFCLISLVRNILEGWYIFHFKGGIHRSIWSTKTFLYDIREPRYKLNNIGYHIPNI